MKARTYLALLRFVRMTDAVYHDPLRRQKRREANPPSRGQDIIWSALGWAVIAVWAYVILTTPAYAQRFPDTLYCVDEDGLDLGVCKHLPINGIGTQNPPNPAHFLPLPSGQAQGCWWCPKDVPADYQGRLGGGGRR